jgi:hypothetical protein
VILPARRADDLPRWQPLGTEIDATTAGLDHVID